METLGTKPMKAREYLIAGVVIFASVVGLTVYSAYFPPSQSTQVTQPFKATPHSETTIHIGDSFKSEDITYVCATKEQVMEVRDGIRAMDNATISSHMVNNGGGCLYGPGIPFTVVDIDSADGLVGVRLSYAQNGGVMWTLKKLAAHAMQKDSNPSSSP